MKESLTVLTLGKLVEREFEDLDQFICSLEGEESELNNEQKVTLLVKSTKLRDRVIELLSHKNILTDEAIEDLQGVKKYCEAYLNLLEVEI